MKKEKEKWQRKWEVELQERIQKERKDWEEKTEIDILQRIQTEKVVRSRSKKRLEQKLRKKIQAKDARVLIKYIALF